MKRTFMNMVMSCFAALTVLAANIGGTALAAEDDPAVHATMIGDLNCDGDVTLNDGVLMAKLAGSVSGVEISTVGRLNADVNADGTVSVDDLTEMVRFLANIEGTAITLRLLDPVVTTTQDNTAVMIESEEYVETTETTETTTAAAVTTAAEAVTTLTTSATTTTTTTVTLPVKSTNFTVSGKQFPLGVETSALIGMIGNETRMLAVQYETAMMRFQVYNADTDRLLIAISADDIVVGYYAFGSSYTAPEGYRATEYVDVHSRGTGKLYAVLVLREDISLRASKIANKNELNEMAQLNYYATNALRALNNLPALRWDYSIAAFAMNHSRDMADNNYFSHVDASGKKFRDYLVEAGMSYASCSENIDAGYWDPFAAADGWYNSETGHRENILSQRATQIGIAFAYNFDSDYKIYGTQDYFAPLYPENQGTAESAVTTVTAAIGTTTTTNTTTTAAATTAEIQNATETSESTTTTMTTIVIPAQATETNADPVDTAVKHEEETFPTQSTTGNPAGTVTTLVVNATTATTPEIVIPVSVRETAFIGDRELPLGIRTSEMIGIFGSETEMIAVRYEKMTIRFQVYEHGAETFVVISSDDIIIGYYALGETCSVPEGYKVTEYIDTYSQGTGKLYAALILKEGVSIDMLDLESKDNLDYMARLNFYATNALRSLNGLTALQWSPLAAQTALAHSMDMAENEYFEHNNLNDMTPGQRMKEAGITTSMTTENIDAGYRDPFTAVHGWYTSEKGHRNSMLHPNMRYIGIGFAFNPDYIQDPAHIYVSYGTQDFYK